MSEPPLTALARSLPSTVPFVGPEAQERANGRRFEARLGANESGFGPSPRVVEAIAAAAPQVWRYGDPECHDLRAALADHHGIAPERIVPGEGIDGLLGYLVRLLVEPGDAVVTSRGAYPTFNYHVNGYAGTLRTVPYRDDHEDPDALLAAAHEHGAKLVYLANPDNPMGTWHGAERVRDFAKALPEGCVLCLDEAYGEFAPAGTLPPLDALGDNVVRMRTFSKAYGLAGLRVGYALAAPQMAASFNKVRNHFGLGTVAQAAAVAALRDRDHLASVVRAVEGAEERIARVARREGLRPIDSATNFVALDCGRDGAFARAVVAALGRRGVFVRMPFTAPEDRCIRVSAGPDHELDLFEAALGPALREAAA